MHKWTRLGFYVSALLLPSLIILVLGNRFAPPLTARPAYKADSGGPELLAALSGEANQMALAIIAATAFLLRESGQRSTSLSYWIVGAAPLLLSLVSIFCGFSYRIAVATQISADMFDPGRISVRLDIQGLMLLAAISALILLALLTYLPHASAEGEVRPPGETDE
jgi:hypothetical protein